LNPGCDPCVASRSSNGFGAQVWLAFVYFAARDFFVPKEGMTMVTIHYPVRRLILAG
jgi:hypothetical protein